MKQKNSMEESEDMMMTDGAYYKLHPELSLRGWEGIPYAAVWKNRQYPLPVSAAEMRALELCSGRIDLSMPIIPEEVRRLIPELEKNGAVVRCEAGDAVSPEQEYRRYPARYIRTAHWSVTGRCNYRCKHCYMSAPDAKYGELPHEQVMEIARQIIECGVREVSLTGGEPLVRTDFLDIVDVLLDGGVHISTIYSNGRLVTDKLLDELEKRGVRPEFNMSYDGVDGWHDWLRGIPGAGRIAEEAFLRCKERGFPTGAEMCLHHGNKHLLRETVLRLGELGCRSLKTNPISNVGAWKEGGFGESVSIKELFKLYLDYIPHYYEDDMPLRLMLGGFFMANPASPDRYSVPLSRKCGDPEKFFICNHARMVMYISAEGRTLPCISLSGMDIQERYPLITEVGLAKCITDSEYMRLIETRADTVLSHNDECRTCEHAKSCMGGCRASALETAPDDILGRDMASCELFRGGWPDKIADVMRSINADIKCV